jgi:hypothetical protein
MGRAELIVSACGGRITDRRAKGLANGLAKD